MLKALCGSEAAAGIKAGFSLASHSRAALVKKIGSDYFGANIAAAAVEASGESTVNAIRKLKGHVFHVSLADIRARKLYARIPGEGDLDFKSIFSALDKSGYAGPLTWRLCSDEEPDSACRKTFKFGKSVAKR